MIKVEIDRAKWDRGVGSAGALLREDGCRCALGFVALACGIADSDIQCVGDTNDSSEIADADREARIIALGKEAGIEFVFTGEGKP